MNHYSYKHYYVKEQPIYGSDKLGEYNSGNEVFCECEYHEILAIPAGPYFTRTVGDKKYELKDHLGDVRVVISDRKFSTLDENSNPSNFTADIRSYFNYYPFGAPEEDRTFSASRSRGGFNGKEKLDELEGEGNSMDFGARMYDSRLGRWMTCDPLATKYPDLAPYEFAGNTPIQAKDPDGRLIIFVNGFPGNFKIKEGYWGDVAQRFMDKFNDENAIFKDGSCGGYIGLLFGTTILSGTRQFNGLMAGMADAESIVKSLKKNSAGEITETVKVVTHSMGTAYARGYVEGLYKAVDLYNNSDEGKKNPIKGFKVEIEVDIEPLEGEDQNVDNRVGETLFTNGNKDWVINNPIQSFGDMVQVKNQKELYKYQQRMELDMI